MKKTVAALLSLAMVLGGTASAAGSAGTLASLGLFRGTDKGYELERTATRAEIAVTLVRLLGKEEKAIMQQNPHPFADVPEWAAPYVGYLYENYLVSGISDREFGTTVPASRCQFAAMLLRALGYSDSNGDFSYSDSLNVASDAGIIKNGSVSDGELLRSEMTDLSAAALSTPLKNARRTLAQKLCLEHVFSETAAIDAGVMKPFDPSETFSDVPTALGSAAARIQGSDILIELDKKTENYGLRLYCAEGDGYYYEIKSSGYPYFEKDTIYVSGDPATYSQTITVHGLPLNKQYSFIVAKTSSESIPFEFISRTEKTSVMY